MEFFIFARRQITDTCLFFFLFFFPRGDRINPLVLECCTRALSNGSRSSSALFKLPKIRGHLGPLPRYFFPKVTGSKFKDSHFVQHSEKKKIMSVGTT